MKKILVSTMALALAGFGLAGVAHAEDTSANATATVKARGVKAEVELKARPEIKAVRSEVKELRSLASSTKAEMRAEIKETKEDVSGRMLSSMRLTQTRFANELRRLADIKTKIETRLTKLEGNNASTTEARANLVIATDKITVAQTSVNAIAAIDVGTSTPRETAQTVKTAIKAAQGAIKEAQRALMKVVESMKAITNN